MIQFVWFKFVQYLWVVIIMLNIFYFREFYCFICICFIYFCWVFLYLVVYKGLQGKIYKFNFVLFCLNIYVFGNFEEYFNIVVYYIQDGIFKSIYMVWGVFLILIGLIFENIYRDEEINIEYKQGDVFFRKRFK